MPESSSSPHPAESRANPSELQTLMAACRRYGRPAVYAGLVVLASMTAVRVYRNRQADRQRQAAELFWSAETADVFDVVTEDFPASPLAPMARLSAAHEHFAKGDFDRALERYLEFKEAHPDHFMVDTARMGVWHCQEAMGQTELALQEFSQFAAEQPDHWLAPQAVLGQARCLRQRARPEEAITVYEDFLAAGRHPDWEPMIQEQLDRAQMEKDRPPTSVTVPVPPLDPVSEPSTIRLPEAPEAGQPPIEIPAGD